VVREQVRKRHLDLWAAELRRRLVERRRAEAAAGRRESGPLADAVRDLVEADSAILEPSTRERLCELVAKRLKDRKLLAPEGRFELLEEPAARKHTA